MTPAELAGLVLRFKLFCLSISKLPIAERSDKVTNFFAGLQYEERMIIIGILKSSGCLDRHASGAGLEDTDG